MNIKDILKNAQDILNKNNYTIKTIYIPIPKNIYDKLTDTDKQNAKINGYEFIEIKPLDYKN